ncbi:GMC family oxidoreductase N-terminal domain-containing protein [Kribbella sp. NPDC051770]|uniref:GMC family oxidoreductase n=1 Tax=Kribbella sp. NPDC051770 TaxID=3155413 RepID=UPI00342B0373
MSHYDYIVVGGGTAGSVLAARLTERPDVRVLLLEAGAREPHPLVAEPRDHYLLRQSSFSWGDITVVQAATGTATPLPRGRGLGGSSAINAMLFVRGHRSGYDDWVEAGAKSWGFTDLLPYFKRSETVIGRDPELRGQSGPVVVGPADPPNPVLASVLDAAVEVGHRAATDIGGGLETGFGLPDLSIVAGLRQTAADAYLTPEVLARRNLEIVTDATVHEVRIVNRRAVGVRYSTYGALLSVDCSREVVLAAGAIGSPKLLMLSGVGPADHLRELGIAVLGHRPGVGSNLQDHPLANVVFGTATAVPPARNNHAELIGLLQVDPAAAGPDLQFVVTDLPQVPAGTAPPYGFTIKPSVMRPYSRGSVRLASTVATAAPLIDPNFFADPRDTTTMLRGIDLARELGAARALAEWGPTEIAPGPALTARDDLREYVGRTLASYCHPVGTCAIGDGEQAVVDNDLRVIGIDGLRVADASVMPSLPSANTVATVYAIAERAAELLLA